MCCEIDSGSLNVAMAMAMAVLCASIGEMCGSEDRPSWADPAVRAFFL
jgi:hypothetical protein